MSQSMLFNIMVELVKTLPDIAILGFENMKVPLEAVPGTLIV